MDNNKSVELEEMRKQLEVLKSELHNEKIVSKNLLEKSMKGKMAWIKKFIITEFIAVPIALILYGFLYYILNLPIESYIYCIIICLVDMFFDYKINTGCMSAKAYEAGNLVDTTRKLLKMKRQRYIQTVIGTVAVLIWLVWIGIDLYNVFLSCNERFIRFILAGGLIGGGIGGVAGFVAVFIIYRKMQKTNDELISQINEITEGEEQ